MPTTDELAAANGWTPPDERLRFYLPAEDPEFGSVLLIENLFDHFKLDDVQVERVLRLVTERRP